MEIIAHIESSYPTKFGVPRASGLIPSKAKIIFTEAYRDPACLRGIAGFSHLWLIWEFSENKTQGWHPTVRPPRLGGNERIGVFATRSPFRPNPIGLSAVKLVRIDLISEQGPILHIEGADLIDGTPIYDIKPYISYTDCIEDTQDGFASNAPQATLSVEFSENVILPPSCSLEWLELLKETLALDPRPAYQDDPERLYHLQLEQYEISFRVIKKRAVVEEIIAH